MDQGAEQELVDYVKTQRLLFDYIFIASFTTLFYDYILVLSLEVQFVWFSKWNYTKILYLLTRYIPVITAWSVLSGQLALNIPLNHCQVSFPTTTACLVAGIIVAEVVLALRTWAVWHRGVGVGFVLLALEIIYAIVSIIYSIRLEDSLTVVAAPYVGFRGCSAVASGKGGLPWATFTTLILLESAVLGLMATSAFRAYKLGYASKLLNIIHQDALQYYFYLICIAILNLIVLTTLPPVYASLFSPAQACFHSIFTSRIIINIRAAAEGSGDLSNTELHELGDDRAGITTMFMKSSTQLGDIPEEVPLPHAESREP